MKKKTEAMDIAPELTEDEISRIAESFSNLSTTLGFASAETSAENDSEMSLSKSSTKKSRKSSGGSGTSKLCANSAKQSCKEDSVEGIAFESPDPEVLAGANTRKLRLPHVYTIAPHLKLFSRIRQRLFG
jgi:hypothetical protein